MITKTIRILTACVLAVAAAGCVQNDNENPSRGDEVRFTAGIETVTRTTDGGNSWVAGDKIGIFMLTRGGDPGTPAEVLADNISYTATPGEPASEATFAPSGPAETIYYPQDGSQVDFVAYYPYGHIRPNGDLMIDIFDQKDIMWTRTDGISKTKSAVNLSFSHVMSKVTLVLTSGEGIAAGDVAALTPEDILVRGMPILATLDLSNGIIVPSRSGLFRPLQTGEATFTAIVIPQTTGDTGRTVTFTVGGADYVWNIPSSTIFEAGVHYTFNITVRKTGITVGDSTITPWTPVDKDSGTLVPVNAKTTVTFTDGTTQDFKWIPVEGLNNIPIPNGAGKTVYSIKHSAFPGKEYFIGRKNITSITLKLDAAGNLQLRDAQDYGTGSLMVPIGTYSEFALIDLQANVRGLYRQEADLDLLGSAELEENGLQIQYWNPVGDDTSAFEGYFDGGGYEIANINVHHEHMDMGIQSALFGQIYSGAGLSHIRIVSGSVTGEESVGGICGNNVGGFIINCSNAAQVIGDGYVGGVCGRTYNGGRIMNCHNSGDVSGTEYFVGGITGYLNGIVVDSKNIGRVTSTVDYVGGVCGSFTGGSIVACYNTSDVSGKEYVGGVCGSTGKDISALGACYSIGNVTGSGKTGGVLGNAEDAGRIDDCYYLTRAGLTDQYSLPFGESAWPATNIIGWETSDGITGGYWKPLTPDPLGKWVAGGEPEGINSVFPRLYWEE